jgi:uncharacterized protein (TIGR03435 family)
MSRPIARLSPLSLSVAAGAFVIVAALSRAQTPTAPKFEAAAIRAGTCGGGRGNQGKQGGGALAPSSLLPPLSTPLPPFGLSPGRFSVPCQKVIDLIEWAYVRFADGQEHPSAPFEPAQGGPAWIDTDRYAINAESQRGASTGMMLGPMLRSLLEERFRLKLHRETKEVSVYALTVAKGGAKLQPYKEGSCTSTEPTLDPFSRPELGRQPLEPCGSVQLGPGRANGHAMDLDEFAKRILGNLFDRPVVNKTGIAGKYDFLLEFTPDGDTPRLPLRDPRPADPTGRPSIFTALQEQLGLKIESAKGPGEFLVIDHVERPSDN